MANEQEIKDLAEKTGMTEEYVKSMLGEPTGDAFDIQMGSLRRGMLIKTVEREMKKC